MNTRIGPDLREIPIEDEQDEEWACTFCGGDGFSEVDDPLIDDCDEWGIGDCSACGGTGLRKHQTVF